jgi:hypothetical protein
MNISSKENYIHTNNWVTYVLVRLFCRRDDRMIAYQLYQYFRQCDDHVDDPERGQAEKISFINTQRRLIDEMYNGDFKSDPHLASIIKYDLNHQNSFRDLFHEMFDVFEFDVRRRNKPSDAGSLIKYSLKLSRAYTTLLIMFLNPQYKISEHDIQLAHGCHLVHMLRDFYEDQKLGYLNIPGEDLDNLDLDNPHSESFRNWVKQRVVFTGEKLGNGKILLTSTPYIRIQLIALLYCFRYQTILRQLKENGFALKPKYPLRIKDAGCLVKTLFSILYHGLAAKFAIL